MKATSVLASLERRWAEGRAPEGKSEWSKDSTEEETQNLHPATSSLPSWILDSFWKILSSKVGLEEAQSGDVHSGASSAEGQLWDWVNFLAGQWDSPAPGLSSFTSHSSTACALQVGKLPNSHPALSLGRSVTICPQRPRGRRKKGHRTLA